jgi:hypothetical protein
MTSKHGGITAAIAASVSSCSLMAVVGTLVRPTYRSTVCALTSTTASVC